MRPTWTVFAFLACLSGAFAQARLDRLETGVEREESIRAIKRLQNTYNGYLDNGLWNEIADLLSGNATADFAGQKVAGKAAIAQFLMQQAGRSEAGLEKRQLHTHLVIRMMSARIRINRRCHQFCDQIDVRPPVARRVLLKCEAERDEGCREI